MTKKQVRQNGAHCVLFHGIVQQLGNNTADNTGVVKQVATCMDFVLFRATILLLILPIRNMAVALTTAIDLDAVLHNTPPRMRHVAVDAPMSLRGLSSG